MERLSDGTGNFDAPALLEDLPAALALSPDKARKTVEELSKDRRRTQLVQAVALLRQKNLGDAVKSVNNLLACTVALPGADPVRWEEPEEVADLFSVYLSKEGDAGKQDAVQRVLGISDEEAAGLRAVVESGGFKLTSEAAESEASIF